MELLDLKKETAIELITEMGEKNGKIYCKRSRFMRIQHGSIGWRLGDRDTPHFNDV
jgi:hypothetical protein|tara:strand:- start:1655 stop:1822 length:168 start_codon:yes stop_codon:yes gene_type:complete